LQNNIFLLLIVILTSCGFVDLRQIGISTEPGRADSVLPLASSPVVIKFDTQMIKHEAEGVLHISSDLGTVTGDKSWNGNNLYFVPVGGWTAGIRYTLSLRGNVRSADGREIRIDHHVSFYAINRNTPPLLEWFSPSSGESVRTNDLVLEFHFSRPMDRLSVESALLLDGITNRNFEWEEDHILKVNVERTLSPWVLYNWTLRDSARSSDGVPLPKTYTGYFTTDLDQILPEVTEIFPVLFSDGNWYPTGSPIETGLGIGQGIAIEFSKPMGESALRALRFEPSLSGRTEFLSQDSIVYIFTRDPEPETMYTLIVLGDTRDREGLRIGEDLRINFIPDIPILNVLSFTADGIVYDINSEAQNVIPIRANPATGEVNFSLRFSLMFGLEEKLNTPQRINISPFFPRTLSSAVIQSVNWISDDRLIMQWLGLMPGGADRHYYRLVIPGGRGGISSGTGIFMKEDLILILEVIP